MLTDKGRALLALSTKGFASFDKLVTVCVGIHDLFRYTMPEEFLVLNYLWHILFKYSVIYNERGYIYT